MISRRVKVREVNVRVAGSDPQLRFWRSEARHRLFVAGIAAGKTYAGAVEILRQPPRSRGMVIAPTYKMLKFASLETFMEIGANVVATHQKADLVTTLTNGTTIYWRSGDNADSLRGPSVNWIWLDEAAYLKDESVYNVALGRLRKSPSKMWITTSPAGFNWLYDRFVKKKTDSMELFRAPTRSNRRLPKDFLPDLELQYTSDRALQELEGEFVDLGDTIVKRAWIRERPAPPRHFLRVFIGVDLAIALKTTADFTAFVVAGQDIRTGEWYILDAYHDHLTSEQIKSTLLRLAQKWRPSLINVESVAFSALIVRELMQSTSLPIIGVTPDKDKVTRFMPIASKYEQSLIFHVPGLDPDFEDEICSFYKKGRKDDYPDATSLALGYGGNTIFTASAGGTRSHPL